MKGEKYKPACRKTGRLFFARARGKIPVISEKEREDEPKQKIDDIG
jgi:hypothetical protein